MPAPVVMKIPCSVPSLYKKMHCWTELLYESTYKLTQLPSDYAPSVNLAISFYLTTRLETSLKLKTCISSSSHHPPPLLLSSSPLEHLSQASKV